MKLSVFVMHGQTVQQLFYGGGQKGQKYLKEKGSVTYNFT